MQEEVVLFRAVKAADLVSMRAQGGQRDKVKFNRSCAAFWDGSGLLFWVLTLLPKAEEGQAAACYLDGTARQILPSFSSKMLMDAWRHFLQTGVTGSYRVSSWVGPLILGTQVDQVSPRSSPLLAFLDLWPALSVCTPCNRLHLCTPFWKTV